MRSNESVDDQPDLGSRLWEFRLGPCQHFNKECDQGGEGRDHDGRTFGNARAL